MGARQTALAEGTRLSEYRIDSLLGVGGFGLTYLATDCNLNLKVAVKEYLPSGIAERRDGTTVQPVDGEAAETFRWGRERFVEESRTLASFRHPSIVRVMRFFEANETAYMVMEYVEGEALSDWMATRRPPSQAALESIVLPLLDGLEIVHKAGFLHRDIKPGNIFMRADGSPVLLDFGSARQTQGRSELTAIVSPGWAPFEQYHGAGHQGPWSDLYAIGGVLYWAITGEKPADAASRQRADPMAPAARAAPAGAYTPAFLDAVDWALRVHEAERPQSVAEFRARLGGARADAKTVPLARPAPPPSPVEPTVLAGILDPAQVKRLEAALAEHLGPIAAVMTRKAAKTAASIDQLAQGLAQEIADERARAAFLRRCTDGSRPPGQTATATAAAGASLTQVALSRFAPELLAKAEQRLAEHIGAVARVVVKRAAAKARDEGELYLLIADEISDPAERKAFVRKAISVTSGKP